MCAQGNNVGVGAKDSRKGLCTKGYRRAFVLTAAVEAYVPGVDACTRVTVKACVMSIKADAKGSIILQNQLYPIMKCAKRTGWGFNCLR